MAQGAAEEQPSILQFAQADGNESEEVVGEEEPVSAGEEEEEDYSNC